MNDALHIQLLERPDGSWVAVAFPNQAAASDFQDEVEATDWAGTFRGCVPVVSAETALGARPTGAPIRRPITEQEFVAKMTHLRCGTCENVEDIDPSALDVEDIEDARDLIPDCGCEDPIGYPEIHSDLALFGVVEIDDDYYVSREHTWRYDVSDDLFDSLVEAEAATR